MLDAPIGGGEMLIKAVAVPPPFYARLTTGASDHRTSVDIDLLPTDPPAEWDAVLEGRYDGLNVWLRFRWFVERSRGEARLTFTYTPSNAPHEVQAAALMWLLATHDGGPVILEDRTGERPTTEYPGTDTPAPSWLAPWARLHADVAELERAAGRPAPLAPDEVSGFDLHAITVVAEMLRERRSTGDLKDAKLTFKPRAIPDEIPTVVTDLVLRQTLVARVFGQEFPVARQVTVCPPMLVRERVRLSNGGWQVTIIPFGSDSVEVVSELVPLSENPE
jgi:hypothetical protein